MAGEGSVFRRCGCTDPATGRQFGGGCPRLAGSRHGSWYVRLELSAEWTGDAAESGGAATRRGRPRSRCWRGCGTRRPAGQAGTSRWGTGWSPVHPRPRPLSEHVRLYLGPHLGEVLLAELTTGQVQAMFTAIIRHHQAPGRDVAGQRP